MSSLLLRVGISGVALAVWAAVMLFSAATSATTAIAALVAGVAIAALALRKAWILLQDGELDAPAASVSVRGARDLLLPS